MGTIIAIIIVGSINAIMYFGVNTTININNTIYTDIFIISIMQLLDILAKKNIIIVTTNGTITSNI
jgi:cellulose synthase/poly-beta-1,6-N-acetylglucosamine synthase-like glycosyltransferase